LELTHACHLKNRLAYYIVFFQAPRLAYYSSTFSSRPLYQQVVIFLPVACHQYHLLIQSSGAFRVVLCNRSLWRPRDEGLELTCESSPVFDLGFYMIRAAALAMWNLPPRMRSELCITKCFLISLERFLIKDCIFAAKKVKKQSACPF
jgi:hypothetical protein